MAEHGEEPKLPGLQEFSNEQIYYLAYANVSKYTPQTYKVREDIKIWYGLISSATWLTNIRYYSVNLKLSHLKFYLEHQSINYNKK